jgi:hypothetical protein
MGKQNTIQTKCVATSGELIKTFTEWERRWRRNPDKFYSDQEKLAESPRSYGESCTPYFLKILSGIQRKRK